MNSSALILALIFILLASLLSAVYTALQRIGKLSALEELKKVPGTFFFKKYFNFILGPKKWEGLLLALGIIKQILQLGYATTALFFFLSHDPFKHHAFSIQGGEIIFHALWIFLIIALVILFSLLVDFAINVMSTSSPKKFLHAVSPLVSLLLILFFPVSFLFINILRVILKKVQINRYLSSPLRVRDKILEVLYDSEIAGTLDSYDQKLILSVASFKDRVVKEVMIPKIDIFSLPAETSIYEATKVFDATGYSRIPIYKDTVDHVIGVLLYKDLLKIYATKAVLPHFQELINGSIEKWIKPIMYSPETKRISRLLQEFRSKQIHLAIVVNEYGGTEGIVTIEDILEEIVGDIADEYDEMEELFKAEPDKSWIVDAKLSIIDAEEQLNIKIPQEADYDTIGGYLYHRAGTIPSKGFIIHHDDFEIEVLSSTDRSVDKVRIRALPGKGEYLH